MATPSNHLGEIYNTLRKRFLDSKVVTVSALHGDPPDKYIVTFHLPGKRSSPQGEVSEENEHKIEILIPFGFPKFPPKCKPLTPIFHPDFIGETVFINDYWLKNSNLPDLIVHLAEMINGQHYSTGDEAFDLRAVEWYQEHAEEFPLSTIDWARGALLDEEGNHDEELHFDDDFELILENDGELKITDDLSFEIDDDQLGFELEVADEVDSKVFFPFGNAEEDKEYEQRMHYYTAIKERREFMRLKRDLEGQIEFRELYAETVRTLQNADRLYSEAKSCEKQGRKDNALELYHKVYKDVVDYPAIKTDIARLESINSLVGWDKEEGGKKSGRKNFRSVHRTKTRGMAGTSANDSMDSMPLPPPPPPRRSVGMSKGMKMLLALLALLVIAGTLVGVFFRDKGKIREARNSLKMCGERLAAASYKEAEQYCKQGRAAAGQALLFGGKDKGTITGEIDTFLSSEEMINGLSGKVLINGKRYSSADAKLIFLLQKKLKQANEAYENSRYSEAAKYFTSVQKLSQKVSYFDAAARATVDAKYSSSMVKQDLLLIESRRSGKKWKGVFSAVEDAEKRVGKMDQEEQSVFRVKLAGYKLEAQLGLIGEEMEQKIKDGKWEAPAEEYKKAGELAQNYLRDGKSGTILYKKQLRELKRILLQASLYKEIDEANSAFSNGHWDEAITSYGKAIELINDPQYALLSTEEIRKNNELLKKLILKASIVKSEESVQSLLDSSDLKKARNTYQKLLGLINNSSFQGDPEFAEVKSGVKKKIADLNHKMYVGSKKSYLQRNYKRLFTQVYVGTSRSHLKSPQVALEEETKTSLFFNLKCTENKPGSRPSLLVLRYRYDKSQGTWSRINN